MFDRNSVKECEKYVYEDKNSAMYEVSSQIKIPKKLHMFNGRPLRVMHNLLAKKKGHIFYI